MLLRALAHQISVSGEVKFVDPALLRRVSVGRRWRKELAITTEINVKQMPGRSDTAQ
jgi:hypothetical protein